MYKPHESRFSAGDLILGVEHREAARGPGFVLVHGIGVSPRYFERLAVRLARHGPVYNLTLPGFGSTPKPPRSMSVSAYATLLAEWLDACGLRECVLVGHSMGTQIVTELAASRPDLAARLVLLGPVVDPAAPTAVGQALRLLRDTLREPPSANWIVLGDYVRCGPRWYLTELRQMLGYNLLARLPDVRVPSLVIRGARDPIAPSAWTRLVGDLLHAPVLEIPKAAHIVQHSASQRVADAILALTGAAEPELATEPEPLPE